MPRARAPLTVEGFFRDGGVLSKHLSAWEDRPGQIDMASEVEAAIQQRRHLIVEAGTGTGKTLAYLVPLILAGKRAVISTGTKNLQDQLARKDLPFLEKALGRKLRVAVMKGRANFLCQQKLQDLEDRPRLGGTNELADIVLIRKWAQRTKTGDRAELPELPAASRTWSGLDARREACTGRQCALFEQCFVTRMHQRARQADLIVVNHHLFFADLSLRQDDFGPIIPPHEVVVFDEAHEIEGVVGQFFGARVSNFQLEELARDTRAIAKSEGFGSRALDRRVRGMLAASSEFFALFDQFPSRSEFAERTEFRSKHAGPYRQLLAAITGLNARLEMVKQHSEATEPLRRRASSLALTLRVLLGDLGPGIIDEVDGHPALTELVEDRYGNFVHWIEKRGKGVFLQATPVDVAPILDGTLFRDSAVAILASATLAVGESFEYVRGRLGLQAASELVVPGQFDYGRQAVLYIPAEMPDPGAEEFSARAREEIAQLLRISRGRAFVLFTSYQQMHRAFERLQPELEFPCLMQGQGSNAGLLEKFRDTRNCVLFATASFWQGVDVPGEQLSCVIIDKLPFAVPSDPIVKARIGQIREAGGNPFANYQIPSAVLALKQGFGRLIRAASDRGVLALLDNRIVRKRYGRIFLDSLPRYARTSRLADVARFLGAS